MSGGDWQALGVTQLSGQVRDLEVVLDHVQAEVPHLVEAVTRLDADVERLIGERRQHAGVVTRLEESTRELGATVKQLVTRVEWIEQHLRTSGQAPSVDLDHPEAELTALAATADRGRRACDRFLPAPERQQLEQVVARADGARARHLAAQDAILDVCDRILEAGPDVAARRAARADYLLAKARFVDAGVELDDLRDEAADAARRIAEDVAERDRVDADVVAGERAERELLTRLRTRLAAAVGEGGLLPAWLTGPLGPMPPAGAAQAWLDVAAGLFAYRLTYAVDDPRDALADLPDDAPPSRRRWYADLGRGVRALRR